VVNGCHTRVWFCDTHESAPVNHLWMIMIKWSWGHPRALMLTLSWRMRPYNMQLLLPYTNPQ
jgi:hypothetical protein